MVPYAHGLRTLEKVYLDTTFAVNDDPYRSFPTKAHGLNEILTRISKYPDDTVFHFNAWTLGYEDVWVAIAAHLKSQVFLERYRLQIKEALTRKQVHVDDYKFRLYSSLSPSSSSPFTPAEGPALCGFQFGNRSQAGCLTRDDSVRLHSCEHGTRCSTLQKSGKVIWITPLITRSKEGDVPELGAGGGGGDLIQSHELELGDPEACRRLIEMCKEQIQDENRRDLTVHLVEGLLSAPKGAVDLNIVDHSLTEDVIPLERLAFLLSRVAYKEDSLQDHGELSSSILRGQGVTPVRRALKLDKEDPSRYLVRHSSMGSGHN
ncbi:MAG: hypothetical protein L6R39_002992 [Caloplaca ligustica]|nr:MAG: hypothetical protein L6R39_002992 [Caloplaca ligustica]